MIFQKKIMGCSNWEKINKRAEYRFNNTLILKHRRKRLQRTDKVGLLVSPEEEDDGVWGMRPWPADRNHRWGLKTNNIMQKRNHQQSKSVNTPDMAQARSSCSMNDRRSQTHYTTPQITSSIIMEFQISNWWGDDKIMRKIGNIEKK